MPTKSRLYNLELTPEANVASGLSLFGPTGGYAVVLQGPTGIASNVSLVLPTGLGTTGQALTTDGSGNSYWTTPSGPTGPTGATGPSSTTTGPTGPTGTARLPLYTYTKAADESVTSSTALQTDDDLTTGATTLSEGQYWIVLTLLLTRGDTTNSPQLRFALSASSYGYFVNYLGSTYLRALANGIVTGASVAITTNANVSTPMIIYLTLEVPAAASTAVSLSWAQVTSSTTPVTLQKGSQMLIYKVA